MKLHKLSPSDFRYLFEDCKHCYYQKINFGITLPSIGLPGVFSKMNSLLQTSIQGMNLQAINPDLPSGIITLSEGFLKSSPIPPNKDCFISGRFDIVSELEDGSLAVIDFKISDPKEEKIQKFTHQLHAYKFALENPHYGPKRKVTKMGVVVVAPEAINFEAGAVAFKSTPRWYEIPQNMGGFFDFISQVSTLLNDPLPNPSANCAWCTYRTHFEKKAEPFQDDIPF